MDNDRLKHSLSVANKIMELARLENMSEEKIKICFLIGFNHDIGYSFSEDGVNHNKIGGNVLNKPCFKYWKEVYYYGVVHDEYNYKY